MWQKRLLGLAASLLVLGCGQRVIDEEHQGPAGEPNAVVLSTELNRTPTLVDRGPFEVPVEVVAPQPGTVAVQGNVVEIGTGQPHLGQQLTVALHNASDLMWISGAEPLATMALPANGQYRFVDVVPTEVQLAVVIYAGAEAKLEAGLRAPTATIIDVDLDQVERTGLLLDQVAYTTSRATENAWSNVSGLSSRAAEAGAGVFLMRNDSHGVTDARLTIYGHEITASVDFSDPAQATSRAVYYFGPGGLQTPDMNRQGTGVNGGALVLTAFQGCVGPDGETYGGVNGLPATCAWAERQAVISFGVVTVQTLHATCTP